MNMRSKHWMALLALVCLGAVAAISSTAEAQAKKFVVDAASTQLQFVSDAPLEKFTGTVGNASGQLTVDPNKPDQAKGNVKVEIATIKTGIELRDEHTRTENWLDAAKYPTAEFVITKVSGVEKLKAG